MKIQLLTFAMVLCAILGEAQPWNSSADYSTANNPNGVWKYGRKWFPQATSFNIFCCNWLLMVGILFNDYKAGSYFRFLQGYHRNQKALRYNTRIQKLKNDKIN